MVVGGEGEPSPVSRRGLDCAVASPTPTGLELLSLVAASVFLMWDRNLKPLPVQWRYRPWGSGGVAGSGTSTVHPRHIHGTSAVNPRRRCPAGTATRLRDGRQKRSRRVAPRGHNGRVVETVLALLTSSLLSLGSGFGPRPNMSEGSSWPGVGNLRRLVGLVPLQAAVLLNLKRNLP